jgi:hypothetical protein
MTLQLQERQSKQVRRDLKHFHGKEDSDRRLKSASGGGKAQKINKGKCS